MFARRLRSLRKEMKMSQTELGNRVHVSQQTIALWESSTTSPSPEMVSALAVIFSVSTDYLLGASDKKEPTPVSEGEPLDPLTAQLMEFVRHLTPDQKKFLLAQMKTMLENQ